MALKFKGTWRVRPPGDGQYLQTTIPAAAVWDVVALILKVATQGDRQRTLEHFKGYFCEAAGATHTWSSSVSWAESDLRSFAQEAAANAPLFIEAFHDACASFGSEDEDVYVPDVDTINELLARHNVGYVVRPPRLELRGTDVEVVQVAAAPPTLTDNAAELLQKSLRRSEDLLSQGRAREAVQESLWLLETVSTAFRGVSSGATTVEGKYFNQIVKELRRAQQGSTLDRVLEWTASLHGYLSSPTGGGVRHGLDLNGGVPIGEVEARLFCNLIRSYLSYLLASHERLRRPRGAA
jgi:hypothetical protein